MRALFLTKGLARYRKDLIDGIERAMADDDELVVATHTPKNELWEVDWSALAANDNGKVRYKEFPKISLRDILFSLFSRIAFGKQDSCAIRSLDRIDFIAIQEFSFPMLKVATSAKILGIPCVVCTDLGKESKWGKQFSWSTYFIHAVASWLTLGVIAHTNAACIPLSGGWRPVCFAPHSISFDEVEGAPKSEIIKSPDADVIILIVASYDHNKGHDLLVQACVQLVQEGNTNFKLHVIGTGNCDWARQVYSCRELADRVSILGTKKGNDLFEEFQSADIFVLPTRSDTFGVVVHEAACFGLPLIVSKDAGAAEVLVFEGKNGYVVDPRNTMDLAEKIQLLLKDPSMRMKFGEYARDVGRLYSAEAMGNKVWQWCKSFL